MHTICIYKGIFQYFLALKKPFKKDHDSMYVFCYSIFYYLCQQKLLTSHCMKKIIVTSMLLFSAVILSAQECSNFFYAKHNKGMQYHSFDRKNKFVGSDETLVTYLQKTAKGYEATVVSKQYDKKNELIHQSEHVVICSENMVYIDLKSIMDQSVLEAYQSMEITMTTDNVIMPTSLKVGETLPDATINIIVSSDGLKIVDMTYTIKNRVVESKESLTTAAGSFETYKITYEILVHTISMGIPINRTLTATEWWCLSTGIIRTETFNARGRLLGYRILQKVL